MPCPRALHHDRRAATGDRTWDTRFQIPIANHSTTAVSYFIQWVTTRNNIKRDQDQTSIQYSKIIIQQSMWKTCFLETFLCGVMVWERQETNTKILFFKSGVLNPKSFIIWSTNPMLQVLKRIFSLRIIPAEGSILTHLQQKVFENIVAKGEIAHNKQFLVLQHRLPLCSKALNCNTCWCMKFKQNNCLLI